MNAPPPLKSPPVWNLIRGTLQRAELLEMDEIIILKNFLQKLSDDQFETFINKLLDREGDPRVSEEQVKGRGHPEVVEVMVNVFSEENLLNVAAEVLHDARLVKYEVKLAEDAPAGVSAAPDDPVDTIKSIIRFGLSPDSNPTVMVNSDGSSPEPKPRDSANVEYRHRDPWSNIHSSAFVEKYRMKLIGNVPDPDPLLDLLRHKKVLSDHSYSEIKALPTDDRKMSQLLMGPYLKTKPSCDIFYDYLKKEHPYLVLDLLQN
ncbi:apoptosis-associated speck-like protein containing a CARD [Oryzias melastigma]|uniref:apoptosis-associated speck-like protein containing a CARD n=1 Tax=Oryzias melastigma TaxID=30732 RepID=UPI00168CC7BC|nr:apoptosis-associated speck-like protein containing a CARD [Oryzias melastigma]